MEQADKALSSASGGMSWFGGRTEKYENAADLYTQAANAFRVQKLSEIPRRLLCLNVIAYTWCL
jgi:alpha-soluble NSF attachment protein